jgi:hypothetical protein
MDMHTIHTEDDKEVKKELKPFVLSLPKISEKHFEILNENNSAVMQFGSSYAHQR